MNMLTTQDCNVFLPLWVVLSFCLHCCSLTRLAIERAAALAGVSEDSVDCKCHWHLTLMPSVQREAGCAAEWVRCRLWSGSYADLTHRVRCCSISPPSQLSHRWGTEDHIDSLPFILLVFWIFVGFVNFLWKEQEVCIQTSPECSFFIN